MNLNEFYAMTKDWALSDNFFNTIETAIKKGYDRATLYTYGMDTIDKKWCDHHGFEINKKINRIDIEL